MFNFVWRHPEERKLRAICEKLLRFAELEHPELFVNINLITLKEYAQEFRNEQRLEELTDGFRFLLGLTGLSLDLT